MVRTMFIVQMVLYSIPNIANEEYPLEDFKRHLTVAKSYCQPQQTLGS